MCLQGKLVTVFLRFALKSSVTESLVSKLLVRLIPCKRFDVACIRSGSLGIVTVNLTFTDQH